MARVVNNPHLLRDLRSLNRSRIAWMLALRNALGATIPLAGGAATGHLAAGITIFIGALNVAASDGPGPYHLRLRWMLPASCSGALSVFAGAATAAHAPLAIALLALWGFSGGLLVALGSGATQVGLTSIILLLVFAARPLSLPDAAGEAALILAGGLLQTVLAVLSWPVQRFAPQRRALAAAFRQLAATASTPPDPDGPPPATAEISNARTNLASTGGGHSAAAEALRTLLDEAERIRLELMALHDARQALAPAQAGDVLRGEIDAALDDASVLLSLLADALSRGSAPAGTEASLRRLDAASRRLQRDPGPETGAAPANALVAARVAALAGQLRAAVEGAAGEAADEDRPGDLRVRSRPPMLRLREPLATLRTNLTLRSAACRHAVRLACSLVAAGAVVSVFALPRAYWLPLTTTLVLKPDFTATFARGVARFAGTLLGLLLATGLVHVLFGSVVEQVALAGVLVFIIRSVGLANYAILATAVTALVVTLTALAGAAPAATILERGIYTLAGGILALLAYAAWPTWEHTQTPGVLADLVESYRRYFRLVASAYLDPKQRGPAALDAARQAARLARTNAEASVDRLHSEPVRSAADLDRADGLLASSHRLAHSIMSLEATLYDSPEGPVPAAFGPFVDDVDFTLQAATRILCDPSDPPGRLPNLRAAQRSLAEACADLPALAGDGAAQRPAILVDEADRIVDSVNTMLRLLRSPQAGSGETDERDHQ